MGSPTSSSTASENKPENKGRAQPAGREGPRTTTRPLPSEAPPTGGALPAVLGELAFYYGACWLYHRSEQRPGGAWMR